MILFEKIRYKNILSVGNVFIEIDLCSHKKTLIVGKNGNGKSTFLDALVFCLFGKPFRKTNKPILINSKNKSNLLVELEFVIGKRKYIIRRGLKPNIFEIFCDGVLINQDANSKDYQEYLEKYVLKTNYNSFINVVILGAARYKPFMAVTSSEKRNIIEELLDIQIFSTMNLLVKDKISKIKEEYTNVSYSVDLTKEKIELQKHNIEEHKTNKQEQISKKLEEIEKYNAQIEKTQSNINLIQKHIDSLNLKIQDKDKIDTKKTKLLAVESKIENNVSKIKKDNQFYENNDQCPTCRQNILPEFKLVQIEQNNKKREELDVGLQKLSSEMDKVNDRLKEIQNISKHILEHHSEIVKLNASISEIQKYVTKELKNINEINEGVENLEENNIKLKQFIEELEYYDSKLKELVDIKKYYDFSALLLKDGGIKTRIIKQYLPSMNKLINAYLSQMNFFVNFNINENFEEIIKSRYRDEFKYECVPAGCRITTEDGTKTIKWIVDNNYRGKVLSCDKEGNLVWNSVLNAWSNKNTGKKWVRVKIDYGNNKGGKSELICTDDHRLLVIDNPIQRNFSYIESKKSIGKWSVRSPGFRDNKLFNPEQLSCIVGMLLGDGSINAQGQFRTSHKTEHKQYITHISNIVGGVISDRKNSGYTTKEISILTCPVNAQTKYLRELMYCGEDNKKVIKNIIHLIDEKSLSFWYMDDGCFVLPKNSVNGYVELCTDNFNYEDCGLLQNLLLTKWNIETKLRTHKNNYNRIIINAKNVSKFFDIVSPYIVDCMQYKLPEFYRNKNIKQIDNNFLDYAASKIAAIKYLPETRKYSSRLYDMEIENVNNFVAENTVVHNSFSEGEKLRIDLAILFSFRQIAKMKNSVNTNLLIMDEILDRSLDLEGTEQFFDVIDSLDVNTNIIVISHKGDQIGDRFDRTLKFEKKKDFTRMKEIR